MVYVRCTVAQEIALTPKLTQLEGKWTRDATRGTGGICGVPVANSIALKVSPMEVGIETNWLTGVFKLDGTETGLLADTTAGRDDGWCRGLPQQTPADLPQNVMLALNWTMRPSWSSEGCCHSGP